MGRKHTPCTYIFLVHVYKSPKYSQFLSRKMFFSYQLPGTDYVCLIYFLTVWSIMFPSLRLLISKMPHAPRVFTSKIFSNMQTNPDGIVSGTSLSYNKHGLFFLVNIFVVACWPNRRVVPIRLYQPSAQCAGWFPVFHFHTYQQISINILLLRRATHIITLVHTNSRELDDFFFYFLFYIPYFYK